MVCSAAGEAVADRDGLEQAIDADVGGSRAADEAQRRAIEEDEALVNRMARAHRPIGPQTPAQEAREPYSAARPSCVAVLELDDLVRRAARR
jgi:hypothetical protein